MNRTRATLASTLWLALAFSPLAFATGKRPTGDMPYQTTSHRSEALASSSEINGRADWNVDYPSQLEPQAEKPTTAPAQTCCADAQASAPAHPEP